MFELGRAADTMSTRTIRRPARRPGRKPAGPLISLSIPHTRCPRCHIWARRDPCPQCGSSKQPRTAAPQRPPALVPRD